MRQLTSRRPNHRAVGAGENLAELRGAGRPSYSTAAEAAAVTAAAKLVQAGRAGAGRGLMMMMMMIMTMTEQQRM